MRAQAMPRMEVTDMVDGSSPRRLGELLVADGLITDALVREALEIQQCLQVHMRLGDILVYWKALSRHQVGLALAKQQHETTRLATLPESAGAATR